MQEAQGLAMLSATGPRLQSATPTQTETQGKAGGGFAQQQQKIKQHTKRGHENLMIKRNVILTSRIYQKTPSDRGWMARRLDGSTTRWLDGALVVGLEGVWVYFNTLHT